MASLIIIFIIIIIIVIIVIIIIIIIINVIIITTKYDNIFYIFTIYLASGYYIIIAKLVCIHF